MIAPRPYALLAEISYRCPLHCPYCSNPTQTRNDGELTTDEMDVGRAICAMPGSMWYLASLETGELAGGAAMAIHAGLATLVFEIERPVLAQ